MSDHTSPGPSILSLGDERFVSLSTFRRSGDAVATAVWVAAKDGALLVTTTPTSGKVKRLRNDPRVTLRPCNRRGKVDPGAPSAEGVAEILDDPQQVAAGAQAIKAKYGFEYTLIMSAERLFRRGGRPERVILRLTPPPERAPEA